MSSNKKLKMSFYVPDNLMLVKLDDEPHVIKYMNMLQTIIDTVPLQNIIDDVQRSYDKIIFEGEALYSSDGTNYRLSQRSNFINSISSKKDIIKLPKGKNNFVLHLKPKNVYLHPSRKPFVYNMTKSISKYELVDLICKHFKTCSDHKFIEKLHVGSSGKISISCGS